MQVDGAKHCLASRLHNFPSLATPCYTVDSATAGRLRSASLASWLSLAFDFSSCPFVCEMNLSAQMSTFFTLLLLSRTRT
jgi:hypothetical protein